RSTGHGCPVNWKSSALGSVWLMYLRQLIFYSKGGLSMYLEQGEVIDEIITKIRNGRITRRTFLERAIAVGLTSTAAVSLLEACGCTSNSSPGGGQPVNLNYIERATYGFYKWIEDKLHKQNNGVHVTYNSNATADTGQLLT